MKYLILAMAFTLVGCGGGASTPTAIETVKEVFVPGDTVTVTEPGETETVYVVQDCPVCPEVVEDAVEIVIYYQKSTATHNGVPSEEYVYKDDGFILSERRPDINLLKNYEYDENNNILSTETYIDGNLTSYSYSTYDENNNTLTIVDSGGMSVVYTYTDNNLRETVKVTRDGVPESDFRNTYEGENLIMREYYIANRVNKFSYDSNDNLIYYGIWVDGELTDEYTYTWQEFTEEIK